MAWLGVAATQTLHCRSPAAPRRARVSACAAPTWVALRGYARRAEAGLCARQRRSAGPWGSAHLLGHSLLLLDGLAGRQGGLTHPGTLLGPSRSRACTRAGLVVGEGKAQSRLPALANTLPFEVQLQG